MLTLFYAIKQEKRINLSHNIITPELEKPLYIDLNNFTRNFSESSN